jgi:hypothetical protein
MLPAEVALGQFALERARARDFTWALRTVAAIEGSRVSACSRWRAFADITVIRAESGDPEGARNMALMIPETARFEALAAWEAIAKAQSTSGDAEVTAEWAAGLSPASFKASALLGVANGILAWGT